MNLNQLNRGDFSKICRTCLQKIGTTSIFDDNSIQSMLLIICNIKTYESDGLPTSLCSKCYQRLNDASLFREQCEKSNSVLCKYINEHSSIVIKKEECTEDEEFSNNEPIMLQNQNEISKIETNLKNVTIEEQNNSKTKEKENKIINVETVTENGEIIYKCFVCESLQENQADLIGHYKTHDILPYVCSQCGKQFRRPYNLNDHVTIHRGGKPYSCKLCGNNYLSRSALEKHARVHNGSQSETQKQRGTVNVETISETGEKIYRCYFCSLVRKNQKDLIEHYRTHDSIYPYVCAQCGQKFKRSFNLNDHVLSHRLGSKPYRCDICSRKYSNKTNLNIHLRVHTGIYPYQCKDCDMKFKRSNELSMHRRKHTKEKPFMCPYCGKMMSKSSHMDMHIRTHTGERRFMCPICAKGFIQNVSLKWHLLTHTDIKEQVCTVCSKAFRTTAQLKIHTMTHTNKKPHVCKLCGKGFVHRQAMNIHMNTHINSL